MAGGHGGGGMKHFWHTTMMIHGFTILPATAVLLIYATGAMILHGQWHIFLWSAAAFVAAIIVFVTLSILGE